MCGAHHLQEDCFSPVEAGAKQKKSFVEVI